MESDDEQVALKAANVVIERKLGKPTQALQHSGPNGEGLEIVIRDLSKENPDAQ